MAIKPPSWAKNAIPTTRGWQDPRTNELLKSAKLSQSVFDNETEIAGEKSVTKHVIVNGNDCIS